MVASSRSSSVVTSFWSSLTPSSFGSATTSFLTLLPSSDPSPLRRLSVGGADVDGAASPCSSEGRLGFSVIPCRLGVVGGLGGGGWGGFGGGGMVIVMTGIGAENVGNRVGRKGVLPPSMGSFPSPPSPKPGTSANKARKKETAL